MFAIRQKKMTKKQEMKTRERRHPKPIWRTKDPLNENKAF